MELLRVPEAPGIIAGWCSAALRAETTGIVQRRFHLIQDRVPAGTPEASAWPIVAAPVIVHFRRPGRAATLMNAWPSHTVPVVGTTGYPPPCLRHEDPPIHPAGIHRPPPPLRLGRSIRAGVPEKRVSCPQETFSPPHSRMIWPQEWIS